MVIIIKRESKKSTVILRYYINKDYEKRYSTSLKYYISSLSRATIFYELVNEKTIIKAYVVIYKKRIGCPLYRLITLLRPLLLIVSLEYTAKT